MYLRYTADRRTLAWAVAMPVVALIPYLRPELAVWLSPLSCYLALSAGVIAHNHNHRPPSSDRKLNGVFGNWLSIFYGYPTFAWVPTHNLNHHKFVNKAGDATITWRYTNKHNALVAGDLLLRLQLLPVGANQATTSARRRRRTPSCTGRSSGSTSSSSARTSRFSRWPSRCTAGGPVSCVWGLMFLVPALFALWTIMFFNYVQHVHTDPWSDAQPLPELRRAGLNFLLFNNGLHSAHHEMAGAHWSTLARAAREARAVIDPRAERAQLLVVLLQNYLLAPVFPSLGTHQIGRAPFDDPAASIVTAPVTAEVDAFESGVNAARA